MKETRIKYTNAILVCISVMAIMYSNTLCSPLLTEIAADIGKDVALAGYLPTITTLFMGLSMLVFTVVVEKAGLRCSMALAMLMVTVGNAGTFWAKSFFTLLVGRALVGTGMGALGTGFSMVAATWFQTKERSAFVTIYTLGNSLMTYISFATTIPLYKTLDSSWRACYLLLGGIDIVIAICWLAFGRNGRTKTDSRKGKKQKDDSLGRVLTNRDVWILTIYHSLAILCTNLITNYLPAYLQVVRNCDANQAANWSGIIPLAGMVGTSVGGALSTALGRRRPVILTGTLLSLISMVGLLLFKGSFLIVSCIAIFGFAARYRIPATTSVSTEIKNNDPAFGSAAYALMYGLGSVLGVIAPPVLSLATKTVGMERAMLIFAGALAIAMIFACFVKETGPGAGSGSLKG